MNGAPRRRPLWTELMEGLEPKLEVVGMVQDGSTVAVRYTERGRSAKVFRGMGPAGKSYEVLAMEWFEFEGGRLRGGGARGILRRLRGSLGSEGKGRVSWQLASGASTGLHSPCRRGRG